jgi:hypothetical protein
MKTFSLLVLLTFVISCENAKIKNAEIKNKPIKTEKSINERLKNYFELYELKPLIVINNTEGNQTEIIFSNHKINWLNKDEEIKVKIDNDLFSLKDKVTLNKVWENRKDSVDFVNNWEEIKLFKYDGKELIGIRMNFAPCTGLGCSVSHFLIYDLKTKSKNFFGTFRTDNALKLYNFNNDDKVDYLSKTLNGDAHESTPIEFVYELYSMEKNGKFKEQRDNGGKIYQIKYITFPNDTTKIDKFEQNWIMKIE